MGRNPSNRLVERCNLLPFIFITSLFALWGFANDITNPMVAGFQTIMELSAAKASLIQFAFYGGYATMAIPAALFIRRFSYKSGILLGLALYAVGAFLFIPAAARQSFLFFCLSLYILTFGLAFLETTANPFILSLGSRDSSTRRLNLSQSFNPVGSLAGMAVASWVVLPNLLSDTHRDEAGQLVFSSLPESVKAAERVHDLAVIRDAYVVLGVAVAIVFVVIALTRMPKAAYDGTLSKGAMGRLWRNRAYREGVLAQVFYVGAQIMVWTFIIQYADNLGINKATAQKYNIIAMCLFLSFRFLATYLMKFVDSRKLLMSFGILAAVFTVGAIVLTGPAGLACLVAISAFMSLMFPTIYGIALEDVQAGDSHLGAAFLVMAIVGGALLPPLQGMVIDQGTVWGHPAVNVSYCLPLLCFVAVTFFAWRRYREKRQDSLSGRTGE
ncbi:MAG: L-fucose:H+ symporter permease [Bacteroidales bacterium]|nr:L-fucose:H+ symporter permease [Bacteroidales bacterium]